jgi:hypothetical protein
MLLNIVEMSVPSAVAPSATTRGDQTDAQTVFHHGLPTFVPAEVIQTSAHWESPRTDKRLMHLRLYRDTENPAASTTSIAAVFS